MSVLTPIITQTVNIYIYTFNIYILVYYTQYIGMVDVVEFGVQVYMIS